MRATSHKLLARVAALLRVLCGAAFVGLAGTAGVAGEGRPGPFLLSTRTTEIPERGEVTTTVLRTSESDYSFLSPLGWRSEVDAARQMITWTSPDYTSVLRLQIRFQGSGRSNQLRPEELRQVVLQELPAARITEEFSCPSGSAPGLAFDAERRMASEVSVLSRMAFLPVPGGRAEVLLSTPRERFAQRQAEFTGFLNSFQVQSR
jgi:hypothetical protein